MTKKLHLLLSLLASLLAMLAPLALRAEEGETSSSLATYTYDLHAGWNLIGLILDPDQASQEALRALIPYDYDGTAFLKAKETVPGAAYWVYTETARELVVNGYPLGQLVPGESDPDHVTGAYQMAELVDALPGTQVTRFAPDLDGYVFIGWSAEGIDLSGEAAAANPLTFTMPECRVILTPHYAVAYKLTVDGEFLRKAQSTEAISVGVPEKEGHSFGEWIVEGITDYSVAEDTHAISFAMPANDVTLVRSYTVNNYNLAVDDGSADSPAVTPTAYGASVELNAAEKEGRAFSEWTASGIALADAKAPEQSFAMPANDVEMTANYTAVTYKLSVSADGGEAATESVACGASVEKTAPASEGRKFSKWTITGLEAASSADNPIKFTMPAGDVTLDAEYNANAYALSVTGGKASQASYEYGADVVVEIVTPEGFSFKDWTVVGVASDKYAVNAETHAISFTMPANDVSLTANYTANDYSLTVDNGTPETVAFGTAVEKTAAVVEGKTFEKWTITGLEAATSTDNPIKFTMPAGNVTLTASYTANKYNLTVDGSAAETEYGTGVQKTPAEVEGKTFKDWTVVGVAADKYTVAETTHTISFTMPANDVSLTANYTAIDYSLTVDNGTPETVAFGAAVEKTAAVVEGKTFEKWTIIGLEATTSTDNPIKFTMPAWNVTLTASYTANKYILTVDGTGAETEYGTGVQKTPAAVEGKTFKDWTVGGLASDKYTVAETTHTISFTMPANDVSLTANYTANDYSLTVDNGTTETVAFGAAVEKTAAVVEGKTFEKWTITGLEAATSTANPIKFTMPAGNVTLSASYTANKYNLTVAGGTAGASSYDYGATATATAGDPATGFAFGGWTSFGIALDESQRTTTPLSFTMPANDVSLTANYTANDYSLTVDGGAAEAIAFGDVVSKTAVPGTGMSFVKWSVSGLSGITESANNPFVFTMPANAVSLTANFAATDNLLTVKAEGLDDKSETVAYNSSVSKSAPARTGYSFSKWTVSGLPDVTESTNNPIEFNMPSNEVTLAANYTVNEYNLTVDGGEPESYNYGAEVEKEAATVDGKTFQGWQIAGSDGETAAEVGVTDTTANPIVFSMPACDVSLNSLYAAIDYTLTIDGIPWTKRCGDAISVTAPDKNGYTFAKWTKTVGGEAPVESTDNPIAFAMPADNVTLATTYTANEVSVTVNGEVQEGVKCGDELTVTAPHMPGYALRYWSINGAYVEDPTQREITITVGADPVTLTPIYDEDPEAYLVVELTGDNAGTVTYSATGPDLDDDACRTTQLWLQKIPAGSFTMGSPEDETGRSTDETQHEVTLTEDFYIGVFEMTQQQYTYIYGSNPSSFNTADGHELFPVEQVSYDTIRGSSVGANWPSSYDVDAGSFLEKLRTLTKNSPCFDLPTEAQWEYTCRAGSTTAYSWGDACSADKCNYSDSGKNSTCKVGSYDPNPWSLYDMHGNVNEWCLDWYGDYSGDATDSAGTVSGSNRVSRGGCWNGGAEHCRSASRNNNGSSYGSDSYGFRVVFLPSVKAVTVNGEISFYAKGDKVSATAPSDPSGGTFSEWEATGVTLTEEQKKAETIEVTVGDEDVTLTAVYAYEYCVVYLDAVGEVDTEGYIPKGTVEYKQYTDSVFKTEVLAKDDCRTTQLWLRRIPAGAFTMGSPEDEIGHEDNEKQHDVVLTEDFYIGVFEMTQKQYKLITGDSPALCAGDTRPVERVSYNMIRGTWAEAGDGWPNEGHAVNDDSFLGKLRTLTGNSLCFDLPTEAQWEYACRAGTDTALNTGKNLTMTNVDPAMQKAGRYYGNKDDYKGGSECNDHHTKVGCYLPNEWCLYDMHGNVREWCLDNYGAYDTEKTPAEDPVGTITGYTRVARGGYYGNYAQFCRSAYRYDCDPSCNYSQDYGFRVVVLPSVKPVTVNSETSFHGKGDNVFVTGGLGFKEWSTVSGVELSEEELKTSPLTITVGDEPVILTASYYNYAMVELTGNNAGNVTYTDTAPSLEDDTCRTTQLWLRRIPAGTFLMGSPTGETGHSDSETQHEVTLTEDFYIGVFEMTQQQYAYIYGSNPSSFNTATDHLLFPVEQVSYDTIRGSSVGVGWPSSYDVDAGSFLDKLRTLAGSSLRFDLPTEAQWEYACRAETTTAYSWGDSCSTEKCNYSDSGKNSTCKVGSYDPNDWGLYDMHGNVDEWCLDWYGDYSSGVATDPVGSSSGSNRVSRGGSWNGDAQSCRSACRNSHGPSNADGSLGFRVVLLPSLNTVTVNGETSYHAAGEKVSVDGGVGFKEWSTVSGVELSAEELKTSPLTITVGDEPVILTASYYSYIMVGLTGDDAGNITSTDTAPSLDDDACRTTQLWLRRIPAGTFTMGSPTSETGRGADETQHQVTLTKDFYIGVFEITQQQYTYIYGSNPSNFNSADGHLLFPVEQVSYNDIRGSYKGYSWPSSHAVDDGSFIEKLRTLTKNSLCFDLPTEAQWEYACRAGTTTAYSWGDTCSTEKCNYSDSGKKSTCKVGSYAPNGWGLYDMHGNVCEWCLDWYYYYTGDAIDPVGHTGTYTRVVRDGSWINSAESCRSAYRDDTDPCLTYTSYGLRVALFP